MAKLGASHGRRFRLTPAVAGLGLIATFLSLFLGIAVYVTWIDYRDAVDRGRERAENAVRAAEQHARWLIEATTQSLARIDASQALNSELSESSNPAKIEAILRALPQDTSVQIFDASGTAVLSSEADADRASVADPEFFRELAAGAEWRLGRLFVEGPSNRKAFSVSRRLERSGNFVGAVVISVPVAVMSRFYETLGLGPASSVGLVRKDGWLVARHPEPPAAQDLSRTQLFTTHLPKAPVGWYVSESSPTDGVARHIAYRHHADLPLVSIVGMARDEVLAPFFERLRMIVAAFGAITVVLLGLSLAFLRMLRQEERMQLRLQDALGQKDVLIREVHHRVKNNLAMMAGLVRIAGREATDDLRARFDDLWRRIMTMGKVYDLLYSGETLDRLDLAVYVADVCRQTALTHNNDQVALRLDVQQIWADIDTALPLGLVAGELVTNAFKHAFAGDRRGTIAVTLRAADGGGVLAVQDDGPGLPPERRTGSSGLRLAEALAGQLDGALRAGNAPQGGARFELTFKNRDGGQGQAATVSPR